jgi:hypothetical protein
LAISHLILACRESGFFGPELARKSDRIYVIELKIGGTTSASSLLESRATSASCVVCERKILFPEKGKICPKSDKSW